MKEECTLKSLRFKDNHDEWIVFNNELPEGYGLSMTPQLLGNNITMKEIKKQLPKLNISQVELVNITLLIHI